MGHQADGQQHAIGRNAP